VITVGDPDEGNYFHWRLTPEIMLKAITGWDTTQKYVIEMDDKMGWF
jgi:hypothetical protein